MENHNYDIIDKLDTYMNRPISLSLATQRTPFMKLLLVNRKLIKVNYIILLFPQFSLPPSIVSFLSSPLPNPITLAAATARFPHRDQ